MTTPEEIKKLIIQARSFTPVKLNDISAGNSVNVSLGYGSVRAQALTNVNGNGIAFQTDQGNWYVIGESANDNISNGENRRQIIYRVVRPNPVDKYPVKTIYGITSDDKITFYLGGDRTSKEVENLIKNDVSVVYAYVFNLGANKFFSYINYRNLPSNTFFILANKNSVNQSAQKTLEDEWNKTVFRGNYVDADGFFFPGYPFYVKYSYLYGENERKVIYQDNEITVDNTKLISKTNVNYPDGKLFREDLVLETSSLNSAGEVVKTRLTSETSVTFQTHYPFLRDKYLSFESEVKEFETGFNLFRPKRVGGNDYTYNRSTSSTATYIEETNHYSFTFTTSASISSNYFRRGTHVEGGVSWNLHLAKVDFSFPLNSQTTLPIGEIPPDNPSADAENYVTTSLVNANNLLGIDHPFGVRDSEWVLFNFDGLNIENVYLTTYYFEAARFQEKEDQEEWLDDQRFNFSNEYVVDERTATVNWGSEFIDYEMTVTRTLDYFFSDYTTIFEHTVNQKKYKPFITYLNPVYVPTRDEIKYTVEENNVVFSGANTDLIQDFIGELTTIEAHVEEITTNRFIWNGQKRYKRIPMFLKKREVKNIIKVKYGEVEKELNTGSFGLLDLTSNKVTVTGISPNLENGDTFTITYTNETIKYLVNINRTEFTGAGFTGDFLLAWETTVEGKVIPYVVRGTCEHEYNSDNFTLTITCAVDVVKKNTPSSFHKKLVMNTGSVFSYLLRKNINVYSWLYYNPIVLGNQPLIGILLQDVRREEAFTDILSREILPFTPLSTTVQGLSNYIIPLYLSYCGYINFQSLYESDNLVRNKFFSVVKTDKNKAWVEQWDIKENGDVKYNKVFQVDYVPLKKPNEENNEILTIFAHSYYPT